MALTDRLHNPTPFKVELQYDKGIYIVIPPDGSVDLTREQRDDFSPGQPGTEEIRHRLEYHGLFVLDADLTYDFQALKALEASYRAKKQQYDAFYQTTRDRALAAGRSPDDDTIEQMLASAGYKRLRDDMEKLKNRIDVYKKSVTQEEKKTKTLDPERTCFALKPPKEFISKVALEVFLAENPEIKEEHERLKKAMGNAKNS